MTSTLPFDVAHLLAGSLVLVSFMLLYQSRMYALLNLFAVHALVLSMSVAWQAYIQGAPHLYVTALIALGFKGVLIPIVLHRIVQQLHIHRAIGDRVVLAHHRVHDLDARKRTAATLRQHVQQPPGRVGVGWGKTWGQNRCRSAKPL